MCDTILFGRCHVLSASDSALCNFTEASEDEELLNSLCQVCLGSSELCKYPLDPFKWTALAPETSASRPDLCFWWQELRDRDEALIAHAKWDFSSATPTSLPVFYVLFPAANTSALLTRRCACKPSFLLHYIFVHPSNLLMLEYLEHADLHAERRSTHLHLSSLSQHQQALQQWRLCATCWVPFLALPSPPWVTAMGLRSSCRCNHVPSSALQICTDITGGFFIACRLHVGSEIPTSRVKQSS